MKARGSLDEGNVKDRENCGSTTGACCNAGMKKRSLRSGITPSENEGDEEREAPELRQLSF